jgi:hypothetical protein
VTTSRTARRTGGVGSYSCPALIINVPNFSFLIRYLELWASVTCGLNTCRQHLGGTKCAWAKWLWRCIPRDPQWLATISFRPKGSKPISYSTLRRTLLYEFAASRNRTLDLEVSLMGRQFLNLDALRGLISFVEEYEN